MDGSQAFLPALPVLHPGAFALLLSSAQSVPIGDSMWCLSAFENDIYTDEFKLINVCNLNRHLSDHICVAQVLQRGVR